MYKFRELIFDQMLHDPKIVELLYTRQQHRQHELQYSAKVNLRVKVKMHQVGIFMFSMTNSKPLI